MAIAIRGTTPVIGTSITATVSTSLTGASQPQSGDLLAIIHANDFYDLSNMPTPTVGGSTSGVTSIINADAGASHGHVKSWWKEITSTGDVTVSVTETGTADEEKVLIVYVLSGADTTVPIDGSSSAFSATIASTWVLGPVSPASSDAFLIAHGNSGAGIAGSGGVWSAGTEQYDAAFAGFISYSGITQQLSSSGSTGTRVYDLNGVEALEWAGVIFAIKTGGAAPPVAYAMLRPAVVAP